MASTHDILQQPSSSSASSRTPTGNTRAVAVQHAEILQHRKQVESDILDHIIALSELPLAGPPPPPASDPDPADAANFRARVRLFQPSDYDDLVEERNVQGLCGYTLCGNPHRDTGPGGEWKITGSGDIVRRKDIEKWCSKQCARRALYVKVQLSETAAWERAGIPDIEIDLFDEEPSAQTDADRVARKLAHLKLDEQRQASRDSAALALERGQRAIPAKLKLDNIAIREKNTEAGEPAESTPAAGDDDHLMIEGYKSKLDRG